MFMSPIDSVCVSGYTLTSRVRASETTPLGRDATPLAPPSCDRKVKVFTHGRLTEHMERTVGWTHPSKKTASKCVAVNGPRGTRLSPWLLNPLHGNGHSPSAASAAAPITAVPWSRHTRTRQQASDRTRLRGRLLPPQPHAATITALPRLCRFELARRRPSRRAPSARRPPLAWHRTDPRRSRQGAVPPCRSWAAPGALA